MKVTAQDLTTAEGCAGVEQAVRGFGFYADVLVNNAGVMSSGFFQDADPAAMRRMIDLDVRAVVDLTSRFLPGMLARGRGGVLNVSSMMGFMPVPYRGGLRRVQGLRAVLLQGAGVRDHGHRGDRSRWWLQAWSRPRSTKRLAA